MSLLLLLIALIEILFKIEFIFEALIFSSSLKSLFLEDKANPLLSLTVFIE